MKRHKVVTTDLAAAEIEEVYCFIRDRDGPGRAANWRRNMYAKVEFLEVFPERCGLAPESDGCRVELRNTFYGQYRIIFTVREEEVVVLHIRHGSRQDLSDDELGRFPTDNES
jgi:plasmid stabilization system protein ParE